MHHISFIQALRGFAALSVVIFHSHMLISNSDRETYPRLYGFIKTGDVGVDIFFIFLSNRGCFCF